MNRDDLEDCGCLFAFVALLVAGPIAVGSVIAGEKPTVVNFMAKASVALIAGGFLLARAISWLREASTGSSINYRTRYQEDLHRRLKQGSTKAKSSTDKVKVGTEFDGDPYVAKGTKSFQQSDVDFARAMAAHRIDAGYGAAEETTAVGKRRREKQASEKKPLTAFFVACCAVCALSFIAYGFTTEWHRSAQEYLQNCINNGTVEEAGDAALAELRLRDWPKIWFSLFVVSGVPTAVFLLVKLIKAANSA